MIRVLLFCGLFLPGYAIASVTLLDNPVILADQNGNGMATILIAKGPADALDLRATQFVQTLPATRMQPRHQFILRTESVFTPAASPASAAQTTAVKIAVAGLTLAGTATATLMNGSAILGVLTAQRVPSAYNVTIVAAAGTTPEALFSGVTRFSTHWFGMHRHWQTTTVQLKNGDSAAYRFRWRLIANGVARSASQNIIDLPANSTVLLDLTEASPDTLLVAAGTLKDQVLNGTLELRPDYDAGAMMLPMSIRMELYPPGMQVIVNCAFIFIFLMAGGVVSVMANCYIPNTQAALALQARVRAMAEKLAGIGADLDSQWIALLDSNVKRLDRQLESMPRLFPAYATLLSDATVNVTMYEHWLNIAYDVSTVLRETSLELQRGLPPTMLDSIQKSCELALTPIATGFTTDAELQQMKAALAAAQAMLNSFLGGTELPEFAKVIQAREVPILARVADLKTAFPEFTSALDLWSVREKEAIGPTNYQYRDIASLRAGILLEYWQLLEANKPVPAAAAAAAGGAGAAPSPAPPKPGETAYDRMSKPERRERLFSYLRPDTRESMRVARILVQEMHQDFYEEALRTETKKTEIGMSLVAQPTSGEICSPARFSVRFDRQELQEISACQEWNSEWTFGDKVAIRPGGWDAYHSYSKSGKFSVSVMLRDLKGEKVLNNPLTMEYTVIAEELRRGKLQKWGPETRLEAWRLFMIMTVAMVGIFAAARNQIAGLAWPAAVAAVVGLGFGADALKNLITRKTGQ
jgi:predicted Zn-ribbon and HTH transcriptional regulator